MLMTNLQGKYKANELLNYYFPVKLNLFLATIYCNILAR